MTYWKRFARLFLALALTLFTTAAPFATSLAQQTAANQKAVSSEINYPAALVAIEKAIDAKRKELGIPGASLVIVKDDRVIYMKGLGVKNFEKNIPVTPDTLFAIGSATKAFTALAAVMSVDDGKLTLEDSPKKFLPYFKMRDPETDARITLRDLLSHRSGLNRTDLAMATGKLTRAELIATVGNAKPTAKLGEKFQYQNVMYAAAGEMVARSQKTTWDRLISERIFAPLHMKSTNTTVAAMQASRDFSYGYEFNASTKATRRLPMREIPTAAPAGAINSNARDMAQWLRFMLAGGVIDGKRLVSEKEFNELVSKQMNVAGTVDYGLGWFLRQRDGHKIIEHGGNIDGFNAQVAMMPDQKLGFVLLTNVTASPLVSFAMSTVWANLVPKAPTEAGETAQVASVDPKEEVGTYRMVQAGVDFEVAIKDGKLTLTVPGQPPYPLEKIRGRRYKLADPAPEGFFATFRPVKGKEGETEMYLEQPQGNVAVPKIKETASATANVGTANSGQDFSGTLKDVLGSYENDQTKAAIEISVREGKVCLVVPGQSPYPLVEDIKDKLTSPALPGPYWVDVTRDATGVVKGIVLNQPEGRFAFSKLANNVPAITTETLISKMIEAYGGEANLRRHRSSVTNVEIDLENQGVLGHGFVNAKAPNMFASNMTLTAMGKKIGTIVDYFDGNTGGQLISFAPEEVFSGKRLEDLKLEAEFYGPASWKEQFKSITIKRIAKVGDEDAYVVERVPEKGNRVTDYISTKSFLELRRDTIISSDTSGIDLPQTEYYSDYRLVDGVMVPFTTRSNNIAQGDVVTRVKSIRFDVEIPDAAFRRPVMVRKKPVRSSRARAIAMRH